MGYFLDVDFNRLFDCSVGECIHKKSTVSEDEFYKSLQLVCDVSTVCICKAGDNILYFYVKDFRGRHMVVLGHIRG